MIKLTRNGTVKSADPDRLDYYLGKGWTRVDDEPVMATLKPVKKDTAKTPAVESTVDSEEVVNDEQKGES